MELITGSGAPRLGNRIARALAAEGYRVALHFRQSGDGAQQTKCDIEQAGGVADVFQADVASESQVDRLMQDARTETDRFARELKRLFLHGALHAERWPDLAAELSGRR